MQFDGVSFLFLTCILSAPIGSPPIHKSGLSIGTESKSLPTCRYSETLPGPCTTPSGVSRPTSVMHEASLRLMQTHQEFYTSTAKNLRGYQKGKNMDELHKRILELTPQEKVIHE